MDPESMITTAVLNNDVASLKRYLAAGCDPNLREDDLVGQTLLHIACDNGCVECAKVLIAAGADVNAKNYDYRSSLHLACQQKSAKCAKILIKSGADINAIDDNQWTPLYIASLHTQLKCINALVNAGADLTICDNLVSESPLHVACEQGSTECAEALIRAGADINSQIDLGFSPLHIACRENRVNVVRLLLDCGANAFIITRTGILPSDLTDDPDIKTMFDEYGGGRATKAAI